MNRYLLGIQPTGRLHVGHYLGVLKIAQELNAYDEKKECPKELVEILVADYHSLTTQSKETEQQRVDTLWNVLQRLGFGNLVRQSWDPNVLVLFWELAAQESMLKLTHLPQYKSKEKTVGMLTYPLLMAADIIHSKATHVLVGEDQLPHMEYYREVARKHGFPIAESVILPKSRVMSVRDPSKKMSKSLGDEHCLYLDDPLEVLESKLAKAPTTPVGVRNLKKIALGYGLTFDPKQAAASKKNLALAISQTLIL